MADTEDERDRRGPLTRAAVERAERDGRLAQGRAATTTFRRFEARWDRIVFAGFCLLFTVFMLALLATRTWTGWSTLFLPVALVYGVVGGWLVPRGALRADLAMAGKFVFDQKTQAERKAYARGTLRQLLWTLAQLVVFVGGMALVAVVSSKVA